VAETAGALLLVLLLQARPALLLLLPLVQPQAPPVPNLLLAEPPAAGCGS
jgi:hypothetical protein